MKLNIPKGVVFEQVDNETVLLNLDSGTYFKLNSSGSKIWALIRQHGDTDSVEKDMAVAYGIDPDVIRRDVAALVDELAKQGLVEPVPAEAE